MTVSARKTKNCIEPWRSFQFEAGGGIGPCCSGTLGGNFGNIGADYFEAVKRDALSDIFVNDAYQKLREGLLTGNLVDSCISCRAVHDEDITTEELRQRVVNHLESMGVSANDLDLTRAYAFYECGGNITNRCNFSCIYCSHSGPDGHSGHLLTEMDQDCFLSFVDFLYNKGLKYFNFCGIGELTTYGSWQDLCETMLERYPKLRLRIISNFGKKLSDPDLAILARFDLIHVSCDTLDEQTYAWLRQGGRLPVLLDNIKRLKAKFTGNPSLDPKLVFNVTVTDAIVDKLESLFRFAAYNDMFVHMSSLFVMQGSIASQTLSVGKVSAMPNSQLPHVREVLYDLPRRLKAQNPLSAVWEYKFLYKSVMQQADAITLNRFVPAAEDLIYDLFSLTHPKNPHAYLRKLWCSFDDAFRGIYIAAGNQVEIELTSLSEISYRALWCRDRLDGNLDVKTGPIQEAVVTGAVTFSAVNCAGKYDSMLFEVLSCITVRSAAYPERIIAPTPPLGDTPSLLVREAFLPEDEDAISQRLVDSQEPVTIWCAGLRALQLISNTCLGQANIMMIIDEDLAKKGQPFCGRIIHSPDDLGDFTGKIVVTHSSCPELVEKQIRNLGITNDIVIV
jgi:hypothetical protein